MRWKCCKGNELKSLRRGPAHIKCSLSSGPHNPIWEMVAGLPLHLWTQNLQADVLSQPRRAFGPRLRISIPPSSLHSPLLGRAQRPSKPSTFHAGYVL